MNTASCAASLASGPTMLAECKQAILHLGGTWPPAGTKTTSDRSASPAIFTAKENSGYLAAISTASSKEELQRLCDERTSLESLRRWSWSNWRSIIKMPGKKWARIKGLSNEEAIRVHRLRVERLQLFEFFEKESQVYKGKRNSEPKYQRNSKRLTEINFELRMLTGKEQYHRD